MNQEKNVIISTYKSLNGTNDTKEMIMDNNDIMKKIRVALSLRDTDIIEILKLSGHEMSKSEVSALFRKEDHANYMECGDQVLRKFLNGLITKHRGPRPEKKEN